MNRIESYMRIVSVTEGASQNMARGLNTGDLKIKHLKTGCLRIKTGGASTGMTRPSRQFIPVHLLIQRGVLPDRAHQKLNKWGLSEK
ncbi:hypothetical protein JV33_06940 [Pectobacterium carotovorum subsp. carotovorum]|nr:hypothetical protein JV33_06940 [Pectobacterium carotovorum subsp. carotovorum]KML69311.1 hypothetical protein G032_10200 [Pectobacterium carotovorum subsp. carotovorum ICMP 5702]SHG18960.1 hypothetical protein SAMN05444147_101724 [Pectobacterium carotovorum]